MFKFSIKGFLPLSLICLFFSIKGETAQPPIVGVIGGINDYLSTFKLEWVYLDGTTQTVIDPSILRCVKGSFDINDQRIILIGGSKVVDELPYAGFVFPDGTLTPLTLPSANKRVSIASVALNNKGRGLVGGSKRDANDIFPYGAVVSTDGKSSPLSGSALAEGQGQIYSVAIDYSGNGIIGGVHKDQKNMYVAKVAPNGETSELQSASKINEMEGEVYSVAMNRVGQGVIGGRMGNQCYAAIVDSEGKVTQVPSSAFPSEKGMIRSVGINSSGKSIIGGSCNRDLSDLYAAFIDSNGNLINFSPSFIKRGGIISVSLNSSGAGIIGGVDYEGEEERPYAALVSPSGTPIPLKSLPSSRGEIHGVAIHDLGFALIGGDCNESPYAALVASDGTMTELPISIKGDVASVCAFNGSIEPILEELIPKSFGLGAAWTDSLFSLSTTVLGSHLNAHSLSPSDKGELSIVAESCEQIQWNNCKQPSVSIWLSPFGMYAHHKNDKIFPSFKQRSRGTLLGFDCVKRKGGLIGVAIGYVSQSVHFAQAKNNEAGHQTWIALYGTGKCAFLEIEGALWGGVYQMNHRRIALLGLISSDSRIKGTIWSPHIKIESPFEIKQMTLRPFVQWDWANLWQGPIREKGSSGMNLRINGQYVSLLRSELGCALSQTFEEAGGTWHLKQKVRYINKIPFHAKQVSVHYAGADATFNASLFSNQIEHLAGFSLESAFAPKKSALPTIGWAYQGELGTKGLTHALSLEVKKEF